MGTMGYDLVIIGSGPGGYSAAVRAAQRLAAGSPDAAFLVSKLHSARAYAGQVLPEALALARIVTAGGSCVAETDAAMI